MYKSRKELLRAQLCVDSFIHIEQEVSKTDNISLIRYFLYVSQQKHLCAGESVVNLQRSKTA